MKNLSVFRRLLMLALIVSFWVMTPVSTYGGPKKESEKELSLDDEPQSPVSEELTLDGPPETQTLDTPVTQTKVDSSSPAGRAFAEKAFQKVVDLLSPRFSKLELSEYVLLGRAYDSLKNYPTAQKTYHAGLERFPGNLELKSRLGESFLHSIRNFEMDKDKYKEGIQILKEVIEKDHGNPLAHSILIEVYERKNNKYELRLIYEDLIAIHGEKFEYVSKLCELTFQTGLFDQSLRLCKLGIKLKSSDPTCYINLGLTYKSMGMGEEAEKELKTAANSFSKSADSQLTYAELLVEKKKFIEAFNFFYRGLKIDPDSKRALLGTAHSGLESHNYAESLAAFKKICNLYRKENLTPFRRAILVLKQAKDLEWAKKFEEALDSCI